MKLSKLLRCVATPSYRRALTRGVAAAAEHDAVLASVGPCNLVVDVGANRGQFALAARHGNPTATIVAFEPLATPAAKFRQVFATDAQVTLHEVAIGAARGSGSIHISARDDSSSLLPISSTQAALFPGTEEVGVQTVNVAPLRDYVGSEVLQRPALLKIDVQGGELVVLRSAADLLPAFAFVYVECSFVELYEGQALAHEVVAWLHDRGFVLKGIYNTAYDRHGAAVQSDFLFRNERQ
jgi:FkbM family methyltransferase